MKNAVILLSGGLDSSTVLALAQSQGFTMSALSILYGQRNQVELAAAKRVVKYFNIPNHKIIELDLRLIGGSSLTDNISVKSHHEQDHSIIPDTYVPARNTIMLSLALAYAEVINAYDIFFGANIHDYSGYPDCRPQYIDAFEKMANLATKAGVNPELVFQAIRGGLAGSTVMEAKAPMIMDRNFKPGFRIDLHIKDLANALDTSHGVGASLPLTAAVMEMMQALKTDGMGECDHSALARYYEKLAKVEISR